MSAPAFTPGPWLNVAHRFQEHPCDCRAIASERYMGGICEVQVSNGLSINEGGNDAPPFEEAAANAQLIAAAPDLYSALRWLVEAQIKRGPWDEPLGASEQTPEMNAGIAALAKARGEA